MQLLRRMQTLLAQLYDAPVREDVQDFVLSDRRRLRQMIGEQAGQAADEQVYVVEEEQGVRVGLFLDRGVLERLERRDPLAALDERNLADFCTALEGVSHFHYLVWSLARGRNVSLLELELQAEVDKYASAVALLTRQQAGRFPQALHARMFHAVSFLPQLDAVSRHRYEEANRHAARFCRSLEERFLRVRRQRPELWLAELRRFFRRGHQEKIRQLAVNWIPLARGERSLFVTVRLGLLLRFHPLRQLAQIALLGRPFAGEQTALVRVVAVAQPFRIGADRRVRRPLVLDDRQARMRERLGALAVADLAVCAQRVVLPFVNGVAAIVERDLARLIGLLHVRCHDARP
jgi:hypothetical protein